MKFTNTPAVSRTSPEFKALAARMHAGEITRDQMADLCGIKIGTLGVWLTRSGLTKKNNADGTKKLHGFALGMVINDPTRAQALSAVVDRVMSGEISVTQASKECPEIPLSTISSRVRKLKGYAGLPVQRRNRRNHPLAPATPA